MRTLQLNDRTAHWFEPNLQHSLSVYISVSNLMYIDGVFSKYETAFFLVLKYTQFK